MDSKFEVFFPKKEEYSSELEKDIHTKNAIFMVLLSCNYCYYLYLFIYSFLYLFCV